MMEERPFWSTPTDELLQQLHTTPQGLTSSEARRRLTRYGLNALRPTRTYSDLSLFLRQFTNPIILILIFAALLSIFLGDVTDSIIILVIIFISGVLGFWQERGAANAVRKLLAIVQIKAAVLRDGKEIEIPVEYVVPGDIVVLNAGDVVPGDCQVMEAKNLFVDEAALTGESYPAEKSPGTTSPDAPLSQRTNALFMGTHAVSGTAKAVVVQTGKRTEFGQVSERLRLRPPETEFEHGVKQFGYFLIEVTLMLVLAIFAINVFLARPVLQSFLFSLALAVGLTPQLLPAIISVNLAHGAQRMAREKVIVKRLESIENFGSMNVFCADKTGTLTEGTVKLHSGLDIDGHEDKQVLLYAYINAKFESGFVNPIDEAIRNSQDFDISSYKKLDEEPYDFDRKRLSILVEKDGTHLMITKGALSNVLEVCSSAETAEEKVVDLASQRQTIRHQYEELSNQGFRLLGLAYKDVGSENLIGKDDEKDMVFLGFIVLFDPPKPGVKEAVDHLESLGISLKVITGDNELVAAAVGRQVGLSRARILSGPWVHRMSDEALTRRVESVDIFAEVEPNHKERIIYALKRAGNVVGYLGDGINDASAIHAADVGISVDSAVDVAKEAADIVLLEKDLEVLAHGVSDGRRTFANTIKYVFMATSANFGNMFSMAGASLFLPFLPLLPSQILLTNLLTDFPEMTIATDNVDPEMVDKPRRWDIKFIRNFMVTFGPISSIFDFITFGVLLFILNAQTTEFRSGWFVESVVSASLVVLVVRSRRPFFRSRPGKYLLWATGLTVVTATLIPYSPLSTVLGFTPLPISFLIANAIIVILYMTTAEIAKRVFYRVVKY